MPQNKPIEKITLRLFQGDAKRLAAYYPNVGYNKAIRTLVSRHLKALDEKVIADAESMKPLPEVELNEPTN